MFQLCESMKWAHLPLAGGLYDQDPDLLDGFQIIFAARAEHEAAERKKEEAKKNRGMGSSSRGSGGGRRRR